MYRNQRRNVRNPKRYNAVENLKKECYNDNIEEVLPPKERRNPFVSDKSMTNRCCYVSPEYKDVEQSTEYTGVDDQFQNLILEQYDFDPTIPDQIKQLKELRKVLCGGKTKVENCSQYVRPRRPSYIETPDGSQWQSIDNIDEIEEYLSAEKDYSYSKGIPPDKNIYISDVPKIKVIVEKFSKLKKDNVEVRKLEEKIVCIEYEVFEEKTENNYPKEPIQKMRAYFSIKPTIENNIDNPVEALPSSVKRNFNISEGDLRKLSEKEIEIIDSEIAGNKQYLDDLKKVLIRSRVDARKKSCLDLMALYTMAKRDFLAEDYNANLLSNAGLQEIKDLVKRQSAHSKHGINRKTIRNDKDCTKSGQKNVISQSIFNELMKSYDYK